MERGVANRGFLTAALSSQLEVGNRIHTDILIIAYDRDGTIANDVRGPRRGGQKAGLSPRSTR